MEASGNVVSAVPDMGQAYWMHVGRMERCKRLGLPKMLAIASMLFAVSYLLFGYVWPWANWNCIDKGLFAPDPHWVYELALHLSIMGVVICLGVGVTVVAVGIINARQQHIWRRTIPSKPEHYSPDIAETAYHLEFEIERREKFVRDRAELDESIGNLSTGIVERQARIDAYRAVMAEEDIDVLTLHS